MLKAMVKNATAPTSPVNASGLVPRKANERAPLTTMIANMNPIMVVFYIPLLGARGSEIVDLLVIHERSRLVSGIRHVFFVGTSDNAAVESRSLNEVHRFESKNACYVDGGDRGRLVQRHDD